MPGKEISAENPGLTAPSRCCPVFNPFWAVAGPRGGGCWERWSGAWSRPQRGCRKLEEWKVGKNQETEGKRLFPPDW